jgi:hypothetical protein
MATALRQLLRDLRDGAVASVRAALAVLWALWRASWAVGILLLFVLLIWRIVVVTPPRHPPPNWRWSREGDSGKENAQQRRQQTWQIKRSLCSEAKACKKYNEARLECATAGNFKTCLRIKMDEDASYAEVCSGYDLGAPAIPLASRNTKRG